MSAFFDPRVIAKIENELLVLDCNVLSSLLNKEYFKDFVNALPKNNFLIDPIVKLEFLRGAYKNNTYKEQSKFLEFERFYNMTDHRILQEKINTEVFNIGRIYSHKGNQNVPLGDIFIIARISIYDYNVLFLTLDRNDFNAILFDRVGVISIERTLTDKGTSRTILENIEILKFNKVKYRKCLKDLPD